MKIWKLSQNINKETNVDEFLKVFISLTLLVTGLLLLYINLPGWSLLLGLPITIMGTVFIIHVYDDIVYAKTVGVYTGNIVNCSVCGKITPEVKDVPEEKTVCEKCIDKIRSGVL